jgi:hypothetical protein
MASPRGRALLWAAVTLCAGAPVAAHAQITDTTQVPVDSVIVTPGARPVISAATPDSALAPMTPRGAFIRSMVVPGWGQAAFDRPVRGGVYFAGWAANWFMIFRNQVRLDEARSRFDQRVEQIEAQLIAESPNPDSLRAVLDSVPSLLEAAVRADEGLGDTGNSLRKLVRGREQQREDWIAWSIFWMLASGVDAYVTAHLSDFPADIDIRRNPDRSLSLGLQLPLPRSRP